MARASDPPAAVPAARRGPPAEPWEPRPEERQFFLDDVEDGMWICRRDPNLRRPIQELIMRSADGIPFVAPEIQLLYKAKHCKAEHDQDKNEHDFAETLPALDDARRSWLRHALELVHPAHPWLDAVT